MRSRGAAALALAAAAFGGCADPGPKPAGPPVVIASKSFTESVILGEIAADIVRGTGLAVEHRRQLGGTKVVWRALETGAVDVYADYTGTLYEEILRDETPHRTLDELDAALARRGLARTAPLGFDNGYALAMTDARAEALGVRRISDLAAHPDLRLVFSNEVMDRRDGWPGLRARYALPQVARGMDHDLAYRALDAGAADVMDIYATDAEIRAHHLRVLEDDRGYFPSYAALFVYRAGLAGRTPSPVPALRRLEGRFTAPGMIALNARAKLDHVPESEVAVDFLRQTHMEVSLPSALAPPKESAVATIVVCSTACRWAWSPPAARASAGWSSGPPGCSRRCRRSPCSSSSSPWSASGRRRRWWRFFSTACSPSCATPTPASSVSPSRCATRRGRWACGRERASASWSCRWRCRPSSRASRLPR